MEQFEKGWRDFHELHNLRVSRNTVEPLAAEGLLGTMLQFEENSR
jgi:hypothetical protein